MLTKRAFIAGSDPYANFDYGMLKPVIRTDCIRRLALAYRETARLSEDFMYLTDFFAAGETGFLIAQRCTTGPSRSARSHVSGH